ncbi:MAG: hypothetical protein JXA57_18025 [Armatimonadetes bacterium]|nr:hypothetical protein [Armatimonadota bacterium]
MRRYRLTGLMACLLLGMCLPAHAIVLRYSPTPGEVHKSKAEMAGKVETSMPAMGQTARIELTMDMDYAEKVVSRTEGVTRVETEVLSGKVVTKMTQPMEQTQTTDVPTGRVVVDLDNRGRVVKMVEADMPGADMSQFGAQGAESFPNWSQYSSFPEEEIKEGDEWTATLEVPTAPDGPTLKIDLTSELIAVTTFQDRKCAKIRTRFSGPLEMDMSGATGGESGATAGTMQGDVLWYYDYENSIYVYGEGTVGFDMQMDMGDMGGMTMKMVMNIKTRLSE